jgi:hypothetical protein
MQPQCWMRIILIWMLFKLIEITADARHSRKCRRAFTEFNSVEVRLLNTLLERVFWEAIARISNGNWRRWLLNAIEDKREGVGRATHLRGALLDAAMRGPFST